MRAVAQGLRPDLLKTFLPTRLGRLIVLPYYPLTPTILQVIVRLQMNRIVQRLAKSRVIVFSYRQVVVDLILSSQSEVASGGHMIDAIRTNSMPLEISVLLLKKRMGGEEVATIDVRVEVNGFRYLFGDKHR